MTFSRGPLPNLSVASSTQRCPSLRILQKLAMGWGGKGKGKGWGGGWGGGWGVQSFFGGKSKGKGKGHKHGPKCPPEKKVWIGGLAADQASRERNKELCEHMKQAGNCKFATAGKSGQGSAQYESEDEVANAIATLNGSTFQGAVIEVDVWTKKED